MLTVHHLGRSQSERIVWLCEELGLDYVLETYARDPKTGLAPDAYRDLHPMGIAPVIVDGDVTLAESGAIVEYLLARHGGGRLTVGPDAPNYTDYLFWFHFANGTVMPSDTIAMVAQRLTGDASKSGFAARRSSVSHDMIEARLGAVPYLAGEAFTAADIMTVFPLTTMRSFTGATLEGRPNTQAYLARIGARDAYRRAMRKGDPAMEPMLA